jgi:hypothetical protein
MDIGTLASKGTTSGFNKECIFCLEEVEVTDSCNLKNDKHYKNILLDITNKNIKLKCNHLFHLECFFLYIEYNYATDLKCPLCRYDILKNDIRKILISYFILLIKLRLKISIDNLFNFFVVRRKCNSFNEEFVRRQGNSSNEEFVRRQGTVNIRLEDVVRRQAYIDDTIDDIDDDVLFLKNKIYFRLRQIIKIILMCS